MERLHETQYGLRFSRGQIVPDGVVRSETNPLGDGTVLLLRLGELLLRAERLVALWKVMTRQRRGLSRW